MKCFYGLIGEPGNALFEMVYSFFGYVTVGGQGERVNIKD